MLRLQYSVHAKLLQSCPTLWEPMACSPPGSSVHGNSPGKNTGVGSHFLLQGIFPTQVSYISCIGRQILYQYSVNIAFICTGKPKKKNCVTCFIAVLTLLQWPATQFTIFPMSACIQQWCWWGTSAALVRGVRGSSFVKGAMCWHLNGASWMEYFMGQQVDGCWSQNKPTVLEKQKENQRDRSRWGRQAQTGAYRAFSHTGRGEKLGF